MMDFELSALNAVQEVYSGIAVTGCLFHLSQNIWKKIQTHGLAVTYQQDANWALRARQLLALAFCPPGDIPSAFEELTDFLTGQLPEELQPVVDYFEDTYVGRPTAGARRPPRFPHSLWSQHARVLQGKARTNNAVEAYHGAMAAILSMKHPSIWKLVDGLKGLQTKADGEMERLLAGQDPRPQKKKYKNVTSNLKRLVETYSERATVEFLRGVAHNLGFAK